MGYGYWTRTSFENYSASKGRTVTASGHLDSGLTDQQIFTQRVLHPRLDPKNVIRECCDSDDHPNSIPVILALDVTGSMGPASAEVAKKMNEVMTRLYGVIPDVEFMVMGIGDLAYDRAPIQISQFESDIRIAEQLDLVYMEHGGGGNAYESYTAAWYMGLRHARLDCWKRGRRGLIITMGDEPMNPYLPSDKLAAATGDDLQGDVETRALYDEAIRKYDIYHLHVNHRQVDHYWDRVQRSFGQLLPQGHLERVTVEEIAEAIIRIVSRHARDDGAEAVMETVRWGDAAEEAPAQEPVLEAEALSNLISWDVSGGASARPIPERAAMPASEKKKKGLFGLFRW